MTYPGTQRRERTALESSLAEQMVALEKERDALVDALREMFEANREYQRLRATSIGDRVHDARDRFIDADSAAECLLSRYPK